jgi:hypothetical protein
MIMTQRNDSAQHASILRGLFASALFMLTVGATNATSDPPAAAGAFAVELSPDGDGVLATWIEPSAPGTHAIRFSRFGPGTDDEGDAALTWTDPRTIHDGDDLFANWADRPAIRRSPDGSLIAHRLQKMEGGTYAYGVMLSRSTDEGATWSDLGWLHDDERPVEHGFVSALPLPDGVLFTWLDGRQMTPEAEGGHEDHGHGGGGAMSLRATLVSSGDDRSATGPPRSIGLDARVCECCDTDMAMTSNGPVVVYRDRGPNEERDIFIVRRTADGWTAPMPVSRDRWEFPACPVNGPSVDAIRDEMVVAWFTAAGDGGPRVLAARSGDGGTTFTPPQTLAQQAIGRTDVVMLPNGDAIVLWIDRREPGSTTFAPASDSDDELGSIAMRRLGRDGSLGRVHYVDVMNLGRRAGFPRSVLVPGDETSGRPPSMVVVWRDETVGSLRSKNISLDSID